MPASSGDFCRLPKSSGARPDFGCPGMESREGRTGTGIGRVPIRISNAPFADDRNSLPFFDADEADRAARSSIAVVRRNIRVRSVGIIGIFVSGRTESPRKEKHTIRETTPFSHARRRRCAAGRLRHHEAGSAASGFRCIDLFRGGANLVSCFVKRCRTCRDGCIPAYDCRSDGRRKPRRRRSGSADADRVFRSLSGPHASFRFAHAARAMPIPILPWRR